MGIEAFEERVTEFYDVLREGSRLFRGEGELDAAARRLARRLDELGIPYALMGAYALIHHKFRRYTEDLDLLVSPEGATRIHEKLVGLGYKRLFEGSKNLRDAESGVRIDVVVAGGYPGDGKEKPVVFPDPAKIEPSVAPDGVRFVDLKTLIELKLASGMTSVSRMKDVADVVELIKRQPFDDAFAASLNPYVQPKFRELLEAVREAEARGEE